jgi:hypothetical protein
MTNVLNKFYYDSLKNLNNYNIYCLHKLICKSNQIGGVGGDKFSQFENILSTLKSLNIKELLNSFNEKKIDIMTNLNKFDNNNNDNIENNMIILSSFINITKNPYNTIGNKTQIINTKIELDNLFYSNIDNYNKILLENTSTLNDIIKDINDIKIDDTNTKLTKINEVYDANIKNIDKDMHEITDAISKEEEKINFNINDLKIIMPYYHPNTNTKTNTKTKYYDDYIKVINNNNHEDEDEKKKVFTMNNEVNKEYKDHSKFIDDYNKNNSIKLYDGENTKRIENILFIFNENENIYDKNEKDIDLVNPNFEIINARNVQIQKGGTQYDALITNVIKTYNTQKEFKNKLNTYTDIINKYKHIYSEYIFYNLFLIMVVTKQMFETSFVNFKYINQGTLKPYHDTIKDINDKMSQNFIISYSVTYMKKYYSKIIKKLLFFFDFLKSNLTDPFNIIDIEQCQNEVKKHFILFNSFKHIIESYRENNIGKLEIYARINNIITDENNNKLMPIYTSDDNTELKIDNELKKMFKNNNITFTFPKIKFNWIFDTIKYPLNEDIATYMAIASQLIKKKGVSLITYGYSGTGKTYTLFGKKKDNKTGLLQATLNNINGLKGIYFRLFEIHGYGLPYIHYWDNDNISQNIYHYDIKYDNNTLSINNVYRIKTINSYIDLRETFTNDSINTQKDSYVYIDGENIKNTFQSIDVFMESVDNHRKCDINTKLIECTSYGDNKKQSVKNDVKRIRETPNNIESSRSILIYDFVVCIYNNETKSADPVTFLIIDLPGRENIYNTYVNPYFENEFITDLIVDNKIISGDDSKENQIKIHKMFLISMTLNPFGLSITHEKEIFDFFNTYKFIDDNFKKNMYENIKNEHLNIDPNENGTMLNKILKFDDMPIHQNINKNPKFFILDEIIKSTVSNNKNNNNIDKDMNIIINKYFQKKKETKKNDKKSNPYDIYYANLTYMKSIDQQKKLACIFFINYLLNNNHFDILGKLYEFLIVKFNDNISKNFNDNTNAFQNIKTQTNFKKNKISKENTLDNKDTDNKSRDHLLYYDYYLTAFEGIYINETINGLLHYLSSNEKIMPSQSKKNLIEKQNVNLNFKYLRNKNRIFLMSPYNFTKNKTNLCECYIRELYDENKLFNFYQKNDASCIKPPNENSINNTIVCNNINKFMKILSATNDQIHILNTPYTNNINIKLIKIKKIHFANDVYIVDNTNDNTKLQFGIYELESNFKKSKNINIYVNAENTQKITDLMNKYKKTKIEFEIYDKNEYNDILPLFYHKDTIPSTCYYYYDNIELESTKLIDSYNSSKIFKPEQSIIETILKVYLNSIDSYKIFYLFSNRDKEFTKINAQDQYELFNITKDFIESVIKQ